MPPPKSDEDRKKALDRVRAGDKVADIAKDLGCHATTIYAWIKQHREENPADPKPPTKPRKRKAPAVATCRVCGCTDDDCSGCIKRTGFACSWVEANLCSACSPEDVVDAEFDDPAAPPAELALARTELAIVINERDWLRGMLRYFAGRFGEERDAK